VVAPDAPGECKRLRFSALEGVMQDISFNPHLY
jgi:hypothetical protein